MPYAFIVCTASVRRSRTPTTRTVVSVRRVRAPRPRLSRSSPRSSPGEDATVAAACPRVGAAGAAAAATVAAAWPRVEDTTVAWVYDAT